MTKVISIALTLLLVLALVVPGHSRAESSPLEAALKASDFAAWFRGYVAVEDVHGRSLSLEEYGDRTHPTAWYPASEAVLAVQADKLRELIGNPFLVA